jgi:hypothetical protein
MIPRPVDYYAVLQVHPTADQEIIDAAYRQLMKKYHPDRAGDDPVIAAEFHERAKMINQAHSVLRDPAMRRAYDASRLGIPVPPPDAPEATATPRAPAAEFDVAAYVDATMAREQPWGPLGVIGTAYSLLPGAYEWERGYRTDALTIALIPLVGLLAWALATGRLNGLLGTAPLAPLVSWALLGVLALPLLRTAPRIVAAAGPSGLLVSGVATPQLAQAHVPAWLAWFGAVLLSLTVAPRLFVFGVLPTLALYLLLARIT